MSNNDFVIEQHVRVADLNYGSHVGISEMHAMAHNARYALLASHHLSELDVGGAGLMAIESTTIMHGECFAGELLEFVVKFEVLSKIKFKCIVSVKNKTTGKPAAIVEDTMICYDYDKKKPAAIPDTFLKVF